MKWLSRDKHWRVSACNRYRLNRDGNGLFLLWHSPSGKWGVGNGEIICVSFDRQEIEEAADAYSGRTIHE